MVLDVLGLRIQTHIRQVYELKKDHEPGLFILDGTFKKGFKKQFSNVGRL